MKKLIIEVPDDLYETAKQTAQTENLPVGDLFVVAYARQVAEFERLKQRAARGNAERFREILEVSSAR